MKAAVFVGEGRVEVTDVPYPSPSRSNEVIMRVAACGLCGSDLRALAVPPEMEYDHGTIIGHEFAGEIVEAGHDTGFDVGELVAVLPNIPCRRCDYCRVGLMNLCEHFTHIGSMRDGGAAEYCAVPADMVHPLPVGLDAQLASLAEPLACVLNGSLRAGWHPGRSALILGAGPIGLLFLLLARAAGASPIIVSEPAPTRADWARRLGADEVVNPLTDDVASAVHAEVRIGVDVAIDAVGSLLAEAIASVRKGGRVLVIGLNERATATLAEADLAYREVTIEGVYIAKGTFPLALTLLAQGEIPFDDLITHRLGLDEFETAIAAMRAGDAVKPILLPR